MKNELVSDWKMWDFLVFQRNEFLAALEFQIMAESFRHIQSIVPLVLILLWGFPICLGEYKYNRNRVSGRRKFTYLYTILQQNILTYSFLFLIASKYLMVPLYWWVWQETLNKNFLKFLMELMAPSKDIS